jgi:hypothetical protein
VFSDLEERGAIEIVMHIFIEKCFQLCMVLSEKNGPSTGKPVFPVCSMG